MKRITLLSLFISLVILNLNSVFSQDLSSNIMRRVNAANLELDKAEEQIRTGRSEHAPRKIKSAQKEYDDIFNYFKGRFDPNNPTLVKLKNRIESVTKQLSKESVEAPQSTQTVSPQKNAPGGLSANIHRRIDAADRHLVWVNQRAASGNRAIGELDAAKTEYKNILNYYKGTVDPNHPEIVALKKRIDDAEQAMNIGFTKKNATAPLEGNSAAVEDMPSDIGQDLISVALSLHSLENRLDTASNSGFPDSYLYGIKRDLNSASDKFKRFNESYKGRFDSNHVAYLQIVKRLKKDREAVSALEAKAGSNK